MIYNLVIPPLDSLNQIILHLVSALLMRFKLFGVHIPHVVPPQCWHRSTP